MPVYTDQTIAGNFDPGNPPSLPTTISVATLTLNDVDGDGFIRPDGSDEVNGSIVTAVWEGDTVTIDGDTITGTTFYTQDGGRYFTPTDGSVLPDGGTATDTTFVWTSTEFDIGDLGPPCFSDEARIAVPGGWKRAGDLQVGDLVNTMDHGPRPIRWIGRRTVSGRGEHAPILFEAGSLGNERALRVSPQHRMLVDDWRAQVFLGEDEVLCPAVALVDGGSVRRAPCEELTYVHLMFDEHEIVFAEGAPSESLLAGEYICGEGSALRRELTALFPETAGMLMSAPAARPTLRRYEGEMLAAA